MAAMGQLIVRLLALQHPNPLTAGAAYIFGFSFFY